jgi:hypothetical protein
MLQLSPFYYFQRKALLIIKTLTSSYHPAIILIISEFSRTLKKASNIGDAIAQCGGKRDENKMLYRSVWKPAVEYTLPQSFLSKQQLGKIEQAYMPKLYAKCGFNRNTS